MTKQCFSPTTHDIGEPLQQSVASAPARRLHGGPGAMQYTWTRRARVRYSFINHFALPIDVWLAVPPDLPSQRNVQITALAPAPQAEHRDATGLNRTLFYTLAPGEQLTCMLEADLYAATYRSGAADDGPELPDAERAAYLRSSRLIRVTNGVRAEARQIVGDARTPLEQARRLYLHLVKRYRYQWPPAARGSEAMRRNRRGDCGEYSWLYAAWCRALGMPCRVLIGTFAHGFMQAHVWNEVFIEGIGWLPIDASMHQTLLRVPILADLDWMLQRTNHHFGRLAGDRLVFSVDPEVPLVPLFVPQQVSERATRTEVGGVPLAWGYESLDGTAPFMQPIYLRVPDAAHTADWPGAQMIQSCLLRLWPSPRLTGVERLLGRWSFDNPLTYRIGTWLMLGGFAVVALGTLLGSLDVEGFDLLSPVGYSIANLIFVRRTGMRWWKLLLLLLLVLQLVAIVGETVAA